MNAKILTWTKKALLLVVAFTIIQCNSTNPPNFEAPLFDNLGDFNINVTTDSKYARRFFVQGMVMANAFNHLEGARSLREAIRLDSTFSMAYWGLAYVLGPNYNTNNNMGESMEIKEAARNAMKYSKNTQPWEKTLIEAIDIKFPADSENVDEQAYADKMKEAYHSFPENDFIVTLYAESIMNQHAWDLYTRKGGQPKEWTPEIVGLLEDAIKLNPRNPLANHLYLHAMEASPEVEKALVSAERLKTLVPVAGHLIHMPSHIYINTGDYHAGSIANEKAVVVDSIYIAECKVQGAYPQLLYSHNYHFLAATAAFEGRATRSIEATFKMAEIVESSYLREPGFETTQHYITVPYNTMVKFAQWEKILALPRPDEDLEYLIAVWHYARGMALANSGKLEMAKEELSTVKELSESEKIKNMMIWEINSCSDIVNISALVLEGEIARFENRFDDAAILFNKAILIEDNLNYNEPPDWFFSVRHLLGDLYMRMGEFAKAEEVYREDLTYWVKNGYSLNGLYHSLLGQERTEEAGKVKEQFEEAWKYAEIELKYSRVDENNRPEINLTLNEGTPQDLYYALAAFCGGK